MIAVIKRPVALNAVCLLSAGLISISGVWAEAELSADSPDELPLAADVLASVRANLPQEPLLIKGQLLCSKRHGRMSRMYNIEAYIDFRQNRSSAHYTIQDRFGTPVEQLTIKRERNQAPKFTYARGNPLQQAPLPDLSRTIGSTQVTWNDLSFSFLWWTNGVTMRRSTYLERDCIVIEFPLDAKPPAAASRAVAQNSRDPVPRKIQLWIDEKIVMLLKMAEYDSSGKLVRRMAVKSLKKISDRWMIKDMDIRDSASGHRTMIRIDEIVAPSKEQLNF